MNLIFILFVHVYLIVFSEGEQCQILDGLWYNDYGSQMSLNHAKDGTLSGLYTAAAGELSTDSEAQVQSDIKGASVYNKSGAVFGMSVMWMNGSSIKAWAGQCLVCGKDEELRTSWLVRRRVDECSDKWLTTSIGETAFKRQLGKNEGNNKRRKRYNHDTVDLNTTTPIPRQSCSLNGKWYNELGSEMIINSHQNNTITGLYHTIVEVYNGSSGGNYSPLYGMANDLDTNSAIALIVAWNNGGNSVTGFVGQCQLCGPNQTETIVTTWLLRSRVNSCENSWSAARVGQNYFTRQKQILGPTKRFVDTVFQTGSRLLASQIALWLSAVVTLIC